MENNADRLLYIRFHRKGSFTIIFHRQFHDQVPPLTMLPISFYYHKLEMGLSGHECGEFPADYRARVVNPNILMVGGVPLFWFYVF